MNIIKRITSLFVAKSNQTLTSYEANNTKALTQNSLDQISAELSKAKHAVGRLEGRRFIAKDDLKAAIAKVKHYEDILLTCADTLHDEVMEKIVGFRIDKDAYESHLINVEVAIEESKSVLAAANRKYRELELKTLSSIVNSDIADTLDATAKLSTLGGTTHAGTLDRISKNAANRLAEARGHAKVDECDLDSRIAESTKQTAVDMIKSIKEQRGIV